MHDENALPVHPRTGLTAVGIVAGRPVWPILGGAPDGDEGAPGGNDAGTDAGEAANGAQGEPGDAGDGDNDGADALGDAGKKALDRMKAQRNLARDELSQFKNLGLSPEQLRSLIEQSDTDSAAAERERQRREAEAAALGKANERLIRAEIKAAATGKLANPAIALRLLDASTFEVDEDGEVDSTAIASAIDDLIKNEPYLAAQGTRGPGSGDLGNRGTSGPTIDQQIADAQKAGNLALSIALKQHKARVASTT